MTPCTLPALLRHLETCGDAEKARQMGQYHKTDRRCMGVANPVLDALAREIRREISLTDRIALARALWHSDIHETRILAAKLLTQARIRPDDEVWALIAGWVPDFDGWAIADHASMAGQRRLKAEPSRLDQVESWTTAEHLWTKRAALVMTLPWAKLRHPTVEDLARQDRILGWAAGYLTDKRWFIQKAVAWWVRDMSKHAPDTARNFIETHGDQMKPFARREASRHLS